MNYIYNILWPTNSPVDYKKIYTLLSNSFECGFILDKESFNAIKEGKPLYNIGLNKYNKLPNEELLKRAQCIRKIESKPVTEHDKKLRHTVIIDAVKIVLTSHYNHANEYVNQNLKQIQELQLSTYVLMYLMS